MKRFAMLFLIDSSTLLGMTRLGISYAAAGLWGHKFELAFGLRFG